MKQVSARIISNQRIKGQYWHCIMDAPLIAKQASPGQFVNLRLSDQTDPLLRRPFSIHNVSGKRIEVLYEVLGKGTQLFCQKKSKESLSVIGPLGNGFDLRLQKTPVIVAGGMGAAPLFFLARKIMKVKGLVLLGARSKEQVICEKEFKKIGWEVKIATDDGSRGFKGRVTDLLKTVLKTQDPRLLTIYSCGPKPMLEAVSSVSKDENIPAQLSLEEHMSCAIGACLGCVVETNTGLKRVCFDGPIFNAKDLIW